MDAETNYLKITNWILPNLAAFEPSGIGEADGYGAIWDVPIDDTRTWGYLFQFDRTTPLDEEKLRQRRAQTAGYHRTRTKENRYLQDREEMERESLPGIGMAFQDQDACVIEGQPILDRSRERLSINDRALVAARTALLRAIADVEAGHEPPHIVRDPAKRTGSPISS